MSVQSVKLIGLTLLTAAMLSGCKKKPDVQEPLPQPIERGEVIGSPTVKTIGINGGTVSSADANIKLVIPEGAVKSDVNISVQEVESTLGPLAVGKTYRLLPDGIKFEKDVDLTINFTSDDMRGTAREFLYLAYQDAKGDWYMASKSTYNPYKNSVSVKTKHFSDWTTLAQVRMVIDGPDELTVKESTKVSVIAIDAPSDPSIDDLLGPETSGIVKRWSSIMPELGTLSTNGDNATYTAPSPHRHFGSSITAHLDLSKVNTGPGRPERDFVDHSVVLLPDEYIRLGKVDFFPYIEKSFNNSELYVIGRTGVPPNYSRSFRLSNSKQAVGEYKFGKFEDTYVRYFANGANYYSIYTCQSEEKYSAGSIVITKNANGYIEGKIKGVAQYTGTPCDATQTESVNGSFRVKIEE